MLKWFLKRCFILGCFYRIRLAAKDLVTFIFRYEERREKKRHAAYCVCCMLCALCV